MKAADTRLARLAGHLRPAPTAATAIADTRVLAGIRVVELATIIAAPACAAVMADMGADVIKIEAPTGDFWRRSALPMQRGTGRQWGSYFDNHNRGKKSVVLDIATDEGLRALLALIAEADVFVTNVRRAGLVRKGLDYEQLAAAHPRLIYAHLTAWGRDGPGAGQPGYDAGAFWAGSGMMDLVRRYFPSFLVLLLSHDLLLHLIPSHFSTCVMDLMRSDDAAPPPRFPGGVGDHTAAIQLAMGVFAALYHRERTGAGQLVDASLQRAGIWTMSVPLLSAALGNAEDPRSRREDAGTPTFSSYRCADGAWIYLLGLEIRKHLPAVVKALGLEAKLAADPLLATQALQLRNRRELIRAFDEAFATRDAAAWERRFQAHGVWFCKVLRLEEVLADEQAKAAGAFHYGVEGVGHELVAVPVNLSCSEQHVPRGRAPSLGAHTAEVLGRLPLAAADVQVLTRASAAAAAAVPPAKK
jgi:crotonobetainyl-CoA:carnitine CoA-transferase CaiB-like acyl-CoA transferase